MASRACVLAHHAVAVAYILATKIVLQRLPAVSHRARRGEGRIAMEPSSSDHSLVDRSMVPRLLSSAEVRLRAQP